MATTDQPAHEAEQDEEEYIEQGDIYAEIEQGDEPMDEDADDGGVEGEIVWEDNSIQHFSGHEGPVYTVSAHPTTPLAVSGGGDDSGYIWDLTDGETVVKLTGHTDSVSAVAFSSDGEMVSTGGMDGRVRVWRRVGKEDYKTWEFLTELQGPDEVIVRSPAALCFASPETDFRDLVQWLRWHPKGPVLLAGSNDSTVWLWQRKQMSPPSQAEGLKVSSQCHLVLPCKFLRATQGPSSAESLHQTVSRELYSSTPTVTPKTISRQTHRHRVRQQYLHLLGPALPDPNLQVNGR
jgi:WD40 repeat protein